MTNQEQTPHSHSARHSAPLSGCTTPQTLLHRETSTYQLIEIKEHPQYGAQLILDSDLQISESDDAYNVAMASPLRRISPLRRVAILGGGDGGVLGELLLGPQGEENRALKVDLVEIDARVLDLSRRYLTKLHHHAFDDPRAHVMAADAFEYIANARDLDAVVYDLTMDPIREQQSRTEFIVEILEQISRSLRPGGMITMQCCSADALTDPASQDGKLLTEITTAASARFTDIELTTTHIPSYEEEWVFLSAVSPLGSN